MTRLVALFVLAALAAPSPALADVAERVRPPDGWQRDADRAARLQTFLSREDHFAGTRLDGSEVAVWSAPEGGASLIVSSVRAASPAALAVAIRGELDAIRGASRAAALDGSTVEEIDWKERAVDAERVIEATLEWRHAGNQSLSISRTLIATRGDGIERTSAECVVREDVAATLGARCRQALATLSSAIPVGQRVAAALPPAVVEAPPPPPTSTEPPRLGDGSHLQIPPVVVAQPTSTPDRRPFYVVGGLLIIGAILLWNRGHRRKVEAEAAKARDGGEAR